MGKITRISKQTSSQKDALYTMEVFIFDGPLSEKFIECNPVISRTIEIRGDQTLEDFHHAIFDAFEREEEHMYEFQIGGKGPNDPKAGRYSLTEYLKILCVGQNQKVMYPEPRLVL